MLKNLKNVAADSVVYGLGNILTRIVGLILLPLYTKELSTAEFGIYGMAEATSQVIIQVVGLSLYMAFIRFYWAEEYHGKRKSIFFTILVLLIINSIILWIFVQGFIEYLSLLLFDNKSFTYLINLMVISSCLSMINNFVLTLIRMQQKTILYSVANVFRFTFVLVLTIIFLTYFKRNVNGIYEALICGQIVFLLTLSVFIVKNITLKFEYTILKSYLKFSYPLIASSISSVLLTNFDKYSIRAFCTLQEVGLYTLAFKIANTVKILFLRSINLAVTPIKYKLLNKNNNKRFYSKITLYISLLIMFIIIGISLFSKEVIELLSQKREFFSAHQYVPILGLAIFFEAFRTNLNFGLYVTNKTKIISGIIIGMSIIYIILSMVFVYYWAAYGAAIATLIVQIIYMISIYQVSQKHFRIPYELFKIIKIIIIAVIIFLVLPLINQLEFYQRVTIKTLTLFLFPVILYFWDFLEPVEKDTLKRILKSQILKLRKIFSISRQ